MSSSSESKREPNTSDGFPRRVKIKSVLRSRYESRGDGRFLSGSKPLSWDERISGVDEVLTENGERLELFSNGGQSTPAPGWELLLTGYAGSIEVAVAPRAADPLLIQPLTAAPHFSDAAVVDAAHSSGAVHGSGSSAPIAWTLYGIAKSA